MSHAHPRDTQDAIAVIGLAGRFPEAPDLEAFWRNLREGVESVKPLSEEELREAGIPEAVLADPNYVRASARLDGVEEFDAGFFGISPREAEVMDPQQRLFLECAWAAFESAGCDPAAFPGRIAVFASSGISSYYLRHLVANPQLRAAVGEMQVLLGNEKDYLATFVSYKLNLRGPSVSVQTACSSSLVGVHLACESLLSGQADMALAGGVSLRLPQKAGYRYQPAGIFSPDGHCRAFDAEAGGTVFGSGAGVVLLKPLDRALADGDTVRGVILGSAVNNDGHLKVGFSAPSEEGQTAVIAEALDLSGVDPATIGYVEAHGTGTALGDPIEVSALKRAFGEAGGPGTCALGSVKTNVGHLDTAAGIAGLIKTLLMLEHGELAPSLHYREPNPEIDFASSPFYVNAELRGWSRGEGPRRAGVSSFGIGGTNVHLVLEEAPEPPASGASRPVQLLTLSARSPEALDRATADLAGALEGSPELCLADAAYTLQAGRRAFQHRRIAVCRDLADAREVLAGGDPKRLLTGAAADGERPVAFLFPGQGAQYPGMTRGLYEGEPAFRGEIDRCAEILKPALGRDLRELLYPADDSAEEAARELRQTAVTQPALFAVEYALARLLGSWGVAPRAAIGHSIGEYVAACLAGVFTLEGALALVALRGELMGRLPRGAMLSVEQAPEELAGRLGPELALAAVNGPTLSTVAGPEEGIAALARKLEEAGVTHRRLHTSHAFHSPMMDPILGPFGDAVARQELSAPRMPFVSNLTGDWIREEEATDPAYWTRHLRETVRFGDGLAALWRDEAPVLLEVGPGRTLSTLARRHPGSPEGPLALATVRHPGDGADDGAFLATALGRLWLAGAAVDWEGYHRGEERRRVPLPTYPFERQRYWVEAPAPGEARRAATPAAAPGRRLPAERWCSVPLWRQRPPRQAAVPGAADGGAWLVFSDGGPLAEAVVERLAAGGKLPTVRPGERLHHHGEGSFTVRPGEAQDHGQLLALLSQAGRPVDRIAYLWSLGDGAEGESGEAAGGSGPLLALAQALAAAGGERELIVVTRGAAGPGAAAAPEAALVAGLVEALPEEALGLACRLVDVGAAGPEAAAELARELAAGDLARELAASETATPVALAGGPWERTFETVPLAAPEEETLPLTEGGAYLVAGGLAGAGFALARHLAEGGASAFLLAEEEGFPAPEEWDGHLASHPEDDPVSGKIRRARELEELGARVRVAGADLEDPGAVAGLAAAAEDAFGRLDGALWTVSAAAGTGLLSEAGAEAVTGAVARGARRLRAAAGGLGERELALRCFLSPRSSTVPDPGCLVPAALGAMAAALAREDGWRSLHLDDLREAPAEGEASPGLTPEETADAFRRALSLPGAPAVVLSSFPLADRFAVRAEARRRRWEAAERARGALARYPRPQLPTPYVAPRNPREETLARIWSDLLGVEEVGVHDDFFDLGGDSLISIQVLSAAHREGLELTARQAAEHSTVAELAAALDQEAEEIEAEQGPVTGPVPLSPGQHWFFAKHSVDLHYYNVTRLVVTPPGMDPALFERVLGHLLVHHDSLRLLFARKPGGWEQEIHPPGAPAPFFRIDLSGLAEAHRSPVMQAQATKLQGSLNPWKGPAMRVCSFDFGAGQPGRLLLVFHHLVLDEASLPILIEDFRRAYEQASRGEALELPPKTTSFRRWSERLSQEARTADLSADLDYWLGLPWDRVQPLPKDTPDGANFAFSSRFVPVELDPEETAVLIHEIPAAFGMRVTDVVLAALAKALGDWAGSDTVAVDLFSLGREPLFPGIDITRTVGWFASAFPAVLELPGGDDPRELLRSVAEQVGRIPRGGLSYGMLRYLSPDLKVRNRMRAHPPAEVILNFIGRQRHYTAGAGAMPEAQERAGFPFSPRHPRPFTLGILGRVADDRLKMLWGYSENLHKVETVGAVAQATVGWLKAMVEAAEPAEASA